MGATAAAAAAEHTVSAPGSAPGSATKRCRRFLPRLSRWRTALTCLLLLPPDAGGKQEKIDIMIALATEANVHQILSELKEYCRDVDKDFARKAMQAVSTCAISFESSVEFCIKIVLGVIEDKIPVVLQEAVVTVQTIFRKYPNRYESIISDVCSSLDDLNEPLAKAAIIWIIGEYSDRIESAEEILEIFFETYLEEESQVQLALLTALSKLYLNVESDGSVDMLQDLLGQILEVFGKIWNSWGRLTKRTPALNREASRFKEIIILTLIWHWHWH